MTLLAEPGSKTVVRARLLVLTYGVPLPSGRSTLAIARISPVFGLLTIAMPPLAPIFTTWSLSARSVSNCMAVSSVSTRSLPGCAGVRRCSPSAMVRPLGSCSSTNCPGVPVNAPSYCCSRPAEVVEVDAAQHPAGEITGWVEPLGLRQHLDAVELEVLHLLRRRVIDLPREVHEGLVRSRQGSKQRVAIEVEHGCECVRFALRIRDQPWIRPHGVLWNREREVRAVAIEHRAAFGGQHDWPHALRRAERGVATAVEQLQLRQPSDDHREQQDDEREYGDGATACVGSMARRKGDGARGTTAPSRDGSAGSRRDLATGRLRARVVGARRHGAAPR